jgi:3-deoxy-D-manno-octulosonic-acid transferase
MTPSAPAQAPKLSARGRVEYALRSVILGAALPFLVGYYLLRDRRQKNYRPSLRERFGRLPQSVHQPTRGAIWIHAVSVGEVLAVAPLVPQLRQRFPERKIVVSTVTETGQELAARQLGADATIYLPLDFGFACRRALRAVQPELVIIAETEFWPRFLREAKGAGARVMIVNGRISDRSFGRYRFWRNSMRPILSHVDLFLMQSEEDARRIRAIGAPQERISVSGNLKYDLALPAAAPVVAWLEGEVGRQQRRPLIVAGSVTSGEESLVLIAFGVVQGQWPRALLVLAPRRPDRFDAAARLAEESNRKVLRRSQLSFAPGDHPPLDENAGVLLLDSVGELAGLYRLADAVFVGGSLVPAGGHNVLEPAWFGKPPLFGPSMENFRGIAARFLEARAAMQVSSPEELGDAWIELIQNPARSEQMGRKARELVEANRGATARSLERIAELLDASRSRA